MKKRIRQILTIVTVFFALALSGGCSKLGEIKVSSFSVDSFSPKGLRSAKARISLCVENPAMEFSLSDVEGTIFYKGEELINYAAGPITVKGKTAAVYPLDCSAALRPDMSLMSVIPILKDYDIEDFTTTIRAKVKLRSGVGKTLKFKNIPLKKLME